MDSALEFQSKFVSLLHFVSSRSAVTGIHSPFIPMAVHWLFPYLVMILFGKFSGFSRRLFWKYFRCMLISFFVLRQRILMSVKINSVLRFWLVLVFSYLVQLCAETIWKDILLTKHLSIVLMPWRSERTNYTTTVALLWIIEHSLSNFYDWLVVVVCLF